MKSQAKMTFRMLSIMLLWSLACSLAVAISTTGLLPEQEQRYHNLLRELRCLVCQNQSIAESDAGLAVDLRDEVKSMIIDGADDNEIFKFMTERYGDFVLYQPPFKPQNYLLWVAPFILLLIGLIVLIKNVKQQNRAIKMETD